MKKDNSPGQESEAKRKRMMSTFRLHTVLIGLPLFFAMVLNETTLRFEGIRKEYFPIAYVLLAVVDYIVLNWRYRR